MANRNHRDLREFRAILIRLFENEKKLTPSMVEGLYDRVFIKPSVKRCGDKEADEVCSYLINIRKCYNVHGIKELLDHFKRFDTMTNILMKRLASGQKTLIADIVKRTNKQLENMHADSMSVIEAIYHASNSEKEGLVIKKMLCDQAIRASRSKDSLNPKEVPNRPVNGVMRKCSPGK